VVAPIPTPEVKPVEPNPFGVIIRDMPRDYRRLPTDPIARDAQADEAEAIFEGAWPAAAVEKWPGGGRWPPDHSVRLRYLGAALGRVGRVGRESYYARADAHYHW
jgi:hypothetical protein